MDLVDRYLQYIIGVKRYSARTYAIYCDVLKDFMTYSTGTEAPWSQETICSILKSVTIRNYEVFLLDEKGQNPRTVNLHLSVISSFCKYLLKEKLIPTNPVKLIKRPKMQKRLPSIFHRDEMERYFENTKHYALSENLNMLTGGGKVAQKYYDGRRRRLIIKLLYDTGMRRSELIGLKRSSMDFNRNVISVTGKGNKMREIPVLESLSEEISLYLQSVAIMKGEEIPADAPLVLSGTGGKLYPMEVERVVKEELQSVGTMGKMFPHMLRHTLATELLDTGTDLNSIKELLGHSSLAATQVYTHNSIGKLKKVYNNAHPRAKRGGNMEIRIKSLKFNADKKLLDFVNKKVSKIERFDESIDYVDVVLSLMEKPENKSVKLQIGMPGDTLIIEKTARTFEEAVNTCVDGMKEKIVRNKEKKAEL